MIRLPPTSTLTDKLLPYTTLFRSLKTTPEAILGRHPPIKVSLYDDSASDALSYYGKVAFHFCGGGKSLLLSISEDAFMRLHRDLQRDTAFVTVESLANQTVVVRTKAIRSEEHTSELQSLMRISYSVFCL